MAGATYSGTLYVRGDQDVFQAQVGRDDGCAGCVWQVQDICTSALDSQDQTSSDGTACVGGQNVCPYGDQYVQITMTVGGVINYSGHWCKSATDPPPASGGQLFPPGDGAGAVHAPKPRISYQPPTGAITQLATYFEAADEDTRVTTFAVTGYPELSRTLTIAPTRWHWTFGDRSPTTTTTSRGGRYPTGDVRHTYYDRGAVTVGCTTEWQATAVIHTPYGDLPPRLERETVVSPQGRVRLPVREARAVLTGGSD